MISKNCVSQLSMILSKRSKSYFENFDAEQADYSQKRL